MGADTRGDLGSILGIWAHPDDEAWLSAGLMMKAVGAGSRVTCVTATKGEAGFAADDPRSLSERMSVRAAELADCLSLLGVTQHRWLRYRDGECAQVPDDEATDVLAAVIADTRPDTVLTFAPDGATGHSDHIAICRWTTRAVEQAGLEGTRLLYATKTRSWADRFRAAVDPTLVMMVDEFEPEATEEADLAVWFTCDPDLVTRKVAAMRAQESQIEAFYQLLGAETFGALVAEEFFRDVQPTDAALIERLRDPAPPGE